MKPGKEKTEFLIGSWLPGFPLKTLGPPSVRSLSPFRFRPSVPDFLISK